MWRFVLFFPSSSCFSNFPNGCSPRLPFTWWGCCHRHKPTEPAHSFLVCSCVYFCLYGPFNCISFHKFSRQLSAFSLCSSGLISALLVLSTIYLFMKVSLSPNVILCGWLGLKHQLTNLFLFSTFLNVLTNHSQDHTPSYVAFRPVSHTNTVVTLFRTRLKRFPPPIGPRRLNTANFKEKRVETTGHRQYLWQKPRETQRHSISHRKQSSFCGKEHPLTDE